MYREGGVTKIFFWKHEKKSPIRPYLAHPAGGQEFFFYLRVALIIFSNLPDSDLDQFGDTGDKLRPFYLGAPHFESRQLLQYEVHLQR